MPRRTYYLVYQGPATLARCHCAVDGQLRLHSRSSVLSIDLVAPAEWRSVTKRTEVLFTSPSYSSAIIWRGFQKVLTRVP